MAYARQESMDQMGRCPTCKNTLEMVRFVELVATFFGRDGEDARNLLQKIAGGEQTRNILWSGYDANPPPTPEKLLSDPVISQWAKNIIRVALQKEPTDAAHLFNLLAKVFDLHAQRRLEGESQ